MSISVSVLGSGSRGNSTFVRTGGVRLLIDCGLGPRVLRKRLEAIGEGDTTIDAVLVTHEHRDHVGGLPSMLKSSSIEAYMTCGTIDGSRADSFQMNGSAIVPVVAGQTFAIGDVEVDAFSVPHDAKEPVAYSIRHNGVKVTQLTDLGWIPDEVSSAIAGSDILIIESNHDLDMLRMGGYPWHLKERLIGRQGHLSNRAVASFLGGAYDGRAQHVVLAHLSSKNNHPAIATQEARLALESRGLNADSVSVASQAEPTATFELG
jgi:phosphoribosyl 1,2-cyclic phosphodiesterase